MLRRFIVNALFAMVYISCKKIHPFVLFIIVVTTRSISPRPSDMLLLQHYLHTCTYSYLFSIT